MGVRLRRTGAALAAWVLCACAGPPPPSPGTLLPEAVAAQPAPLDEMPSGSLEAHRVWGEPWEEDAEGDTAMTRRIRRAARELRGDPIPRLAFVELRFPAGAAEYAALRGYGVLRLTAVCRNPEELPPARVFARGDDGELEFARHRLYQSEIPDSEQEIVEVIGRARADALYLVPLERITRPGQLVVDFARDRTGFVLGELPLDPELDYALGPPGAGSPDARALEKLIARDLPGFAPPPPASDPPGLP